MAAKIAGGLTTLDSVGLTWAILCCNIANWAVRRASKSCINLLWYIMSKIISVRIWGYTLLPFALVFITFVVGLFVLAPWVGYNAMSWQSLACVTVGSAAGVLLLWRQRKKDDEQPKQKPRDAR